MDRLEIIKNEVAVENGFKFWNDVVENHVNPYDLGDMDSYFLG